MDYNEKRVLVTGATGFVGRHLVERLIFSDQHLKIRALVHHASQASQLARFPVEIVYGNMASMKSVRTALNGCSIVVHCAIGTPYETIIGTQNILKTSSELKIQRLVHISSVAVHGIRTNPWANVSEEIDYRLTGDSYCDTKIVSEKLVREYQKTATLPIVILRPANIFGPHSTPWTIRPISMLKNRSYVLVNGGKTPANAVYVDNVTGAIIKSIAEETAVGRVITVSDNKMISWKDFFSAYAKMFRNPPPLYSLRFDEVKAKRTMEHKQRLNKQFSKLLSNPSKLFSVLSTLINESKSLLYLFDIYRRSQMKTRLLSFRSHLPYATSSEKTDHSQGNTNSDLLNRVPSQELVNLFVSNVRFSTRNAEEFLGYSPATSFEEGMEITEQWLRRCRLL